MPTAAAFSHPMPLALPKVDISSLVTPGASETQTTACHAALFDAMANTGFVILQGTGVPADTLGAMRAAVKAVFEAPRNHYRDFQVQKDNYRGYVPLGYFTPNDGTQRPDQYEAWKLHWNVSPEDPLRQRCALYGPNRWPPIAHDVRSAVLAYWAAMDQLNATVLRALAQALGMDADAVLALLDQPLTNMTLLNYPPGSPDSDHWGIHPHKDFNFLTFLAHDPVGGLEVRTKGGEWVDAGCEPDEYVVNIGDMLELLSGGRLVSTPHRVINRSGLQRQAFPYFSVPRFDVTVEPWLPPVAGFERAALQSGAASHAIWYSNWPDEAVSDKAIDLGDYR